MNKNGNKTENQNYLGANENENSTLQNLWVAVTAGTRGKSLWLHQPTSRSRRNPK